MPRNVSDLDLMLLADGELEGDEAVRAAAEVERDATARDTFEGVREVGEVVRTHLELATDEAEEAVPGFERLWANVERAIHANGQAPREVAEAAEPARERPAPEASAGLLERLRAWMSQGWQGHALTGATVAAAVALLMWVTRPTERVVERTTVRNGGAAVGAVPAALESQPPEVENLEVYDGSGTILTIPGEGTGDSSTAVIWISDDSDVEGPI